MGTKLGGGGTFARVFPAITRHMYNSVIMADGFINYLFLARASRGDDMPAGSSLPRRQGDGAVHDDDTKPCLEGEGARSG